jgi:rhamnogalacturonyl hydrolase YesR
MSAGFRGSKTSLICESEGISLTAKTLLKGQQGGILKKHHRKTAHQAIVQSVIDLAALSVIIDLVEMF